MGWAEPVLLPSRAWAGRWRGLVPMAAAPEPHETEKKVMFAMGQGGVGGGVQCAGRDPVS